MSVDDDADADAAGASIDFWVGCKSGASNLGQTKKKKMKCACRCVCVLFVAFLA